MGQFFRTSTPMGDWRSFKFQMIAQGETWTEGQLYMVQETVGVLFLDIQYDSAGCKKAKTIEVTDPTTEGVLVYHIEKVIVKKVGATGLAALPGDKAYWSGVNGAGVTPTWQSGYYWIGIFTEPAAASAVEAEIDLKGDKATVGA